MNRFVFITIFLFILAGCTNKQLYQVGQDYQKSDCIEKAVSESQHADCLKTDKKTYEEYEKERKSINNK